MYTEVCVTLDGDRKEKTAPVYIVYIILLDSVRRSLLFSGSLTNIVIMFVCVCVCIWLCVWVRYTGLACVC